MAAGRGAPSPLVGPPGRLDAMTVGDRNRTIIDGFVHQLPDNDPVETQEWIDSLDGVVARRGPGKRTFPAGEAARACPWDRAGGTGHRHHSLRQHDPGRGRAALSGR